MLTTEKNKLLTETGPGTPMGELMRRYWQPIAGASEFDETNRVKPVRLHGRGPGPVQGLERHVTA